MSRNQEMKSVKMVALLAVCLLSALVSRGGIKIVIDQNGTEAATPRYTFKNVPAPSRNDAATKATFVLVDGVRDGNSGELHKLNDGKLPEEADEPGENFFFDAGTEGGRLLVDLQGVIALKQVNSYSWHPGSRGPQVYTLYASDGQTARFNAQPKHGLDPEKCGWRVIAKVDTRVEHGLAGGQYGVSISDSSGTMGKYRYLLFAISRTETQDAFGNTFYSEIDVVDRDAPEPPQAVETRPRLGKMFMTEDGKYQITIDPSRAPDLTSWAFQDLSPVALKWYPKIVNLLPSDGYRAPVKITIGFGKMNGGLTAFARGDRITCNIKWFRENLKGEAIGCVVHEMVHVVQGYVDHPPGKPEASPAPGWLTEGLADYIRWFIYEPETHGADISKDRFAKVHYDNSYRITANFLDWVTRRYDTKLVPRLNAELREGTYSKTFWKQRTGRDLDELGNEWKKWLKAGTKVESVH